MWFWGPHFKIAWNDHPRDSTMTGLLPVGSSWRSGIAAGAYSGPDAIPITTSNDYQLVGDYHKPHWECLPFITSEIQYSVNELVYSELWCVQDPMNPKYVQYHVWKYMYYIYCLHHLQIHTSTIYRSLIQSLLTCNAVRMRLVSHHLLKDPQPKMPRVMGKSRGMNTPCVVGRAILSLHSI